MASVVLERYDGPITDGEVTIGIAIENGERTWRAAGVKLEPLNGELMIVHPEQSLGLHVTNWLVDTLLRKDTGRAFAFIAAFVRRILAGQSPGKATLDLSQPERLISAFVERFHNVWPPQLELAVDVNRDVVVPEIGLPNKVVVEFGLPETGKTPVTPPLHSWMFWPRIRERLWHERDRVQADELLQGVVAHALTVSAEGRDPRGTGRTIELYSF
jgi:hypothetical protein